MISAKTAQKLSNRKKTTYENMVDSILDTGIQLSCLKGAFNTYFSVGKGLTNNDITEANIKRLNKLGYRTSIITTIRTEPTTELVVEWTKK
jgi:hypothetical protein